MTLASPETEASVSAWLAPPARAFGVEIPAEAASALALYATRLVEWNARINLTGARDLEALVREHFADALALVPLLPRSGNVIDVGSGAGLPGVILAILRRDLAVQLLEPMQKRRSFLAAIARELELRNLEISPDSGATHADRYAGSYEFAVSRAVFALSDWLELGLRLVGIGGVVAGLSGGAPPRLDLDARIHPYDAGCGPRTLILVRK